MERIQPLQVIVLIVSLISLFTLLQSLPIAVSVAETLHFLWKNNEFYNKKLFFDTGVFDKTVYGFTRPVVTGLNARSMLSMRYGDLNSPFEYDLVRALYHNYRKIQVVK